MWRIFRAELRYSAWNLAFTLAFISLFALLFARAKLTDNPGVIFFMPLTVAVIVHLLIFRIIEKRDRKDALLPLSIKQIALARLFLILLPCVSFSGVYLLLYYLFSAGGYGWQHDPLDLLMFLGVIFMGFALYLMQHDTFISALGRNKATEFDILAMVIMLLIFLMGIPLAFAAIWHSPTSNLLRLLAFFLGLIFLYPAVITFVRRKTYLE